MKTCPVIAYEVFFSEDNDSGSVLVTVQAIESSGERAQVGSKEFGPWADWSDVADWIWLRLREALPVSVS